jgi:hypothetical protein
MSTDVTYYLKGDGRIVAAGTTFDPDAVRPPGTEMVLGVAGDPLNDYVVHGEVHPRPVLPVRLQGHWLLEVPRGASVNIDGASYAADGSAIELSFNYKGTYAVSVTLWPYHDWSIQVEN